MASAIGGCHDFDTNRAEVPRGTIGEEVYGVFCDRLSAQLLREDLSGASFRGICHKQGGQYSDTVNESELPAPSEGLRNKAGELVPLEEQRAVRARSIGRIQALARRRAELIEALDATFPDADVPTIDTKNPDPKKSCSPTNDVRALGRELADMLARLTELYNDDTLPASTRSLARVLETFKASPDAQAALAKVTGREGYRPLQIEMGMARPVLGYPRFRDLAAETLRLLSYDSQPYAADPPRHPNGTRKPVPGAGYAAFHKLLEAARNELRTSKVDGKPALKVDRDSLINLDRLSRPRENLEFTNALLSLQNARFGGGEPRFIVKRDARGFAALAGPIEAPFVDQDKDRTPDVDALGRFLTVDGSPAPTPFATDVGTQTERDEFGRATIVKKPVFDTIDTSHNMGAQLLADLRPLVDPNKDALMNSVAGAYVAMGKRLKATKTYAPDPSAVERWKRTHAESDPPPADLGTRPVTVEFDEFDPSNSPMADFVYAIGHTLGARGTDDMLAYVRMLLVEHPAVVADVAGEMLAFQEIAKKHDEAKLKEKSAFWDEILDVAGEISKDRALLEDVLTALADPATVRVGEVLGGFMQNKDRFSYDRTNLNGAPVNQTTGKVEPPKTAVDRGQPDTGFNRSMFQRLVHIVNDADGVAMCNKEGAIVHAKGVPLAGSLDMPLFGGTYKECEVLKVDNLAHFYLGAIVGKSQFYFRPKLLREGVAGIGAATVDTIQQSMGIQGFWDPPESKTFRPKPEALNRIVFFDQANDSVSGGPNATTNLFLRDFTGPHIGTVHCPERVINDPVPDAADASSDGRVHGLRSCGPGDWLQERHPDALFVLENLGAYDALAPLLRPFAERGRQDLVVKLFKAVHRHYQSEKGQPPECDSSNPKSPAYCSRSAISSYEPLLAEAFPHGIFRALHELAIVMNSAAVPHCTGMNASKRCEATQPVSGITVMADATEALISPDRAKEVGLKTRFGSTKVKRNDGTENAQVTPIYLMTDALSAIDAAFVEAAKDPNNTDVQTKWRSARSAIVDQFLSVNGSGAKATFVNPAMLGAVPTLIDLFRAQLTAHCPESFIAPYKPCAWTNDDLPRKMNETLQSPTFASTMDVLESIRRDPAARAELHSLLLFLLDPASRHEALSSMRAALTDGLQMLEHDDDLVPIYHVLAEALAATERDEQDHILEAGMVDAQTSLIARLAARAHDADGAPICNKEIDPNQVLTIVMRNLVTPMKGKNDTIKKSPFDVVIDVIGDVNRLDPSKSGRLEPNDFVSVSVEVSDFLSSKERGLEQFYQIIKNGTR